MKMIFAFLILALCFSADPSAATDNQEAALQEFVDTFFTEFARRNPTMNQDVQGVTSLSAHAVSHFVKTPESAARKGRIAPVDLVSALLAEGPASWTITDMKLAGDAARVEIEFQSNTANRPFTMSFRMIRTGDGWKFIRFEDNRIKVASTEAASMEKQVAGDKPEDTVAQYLDFMVDVYRPGNAANAMRRIADISDALKALWVEERDARRMQGQLQAQLQQLQPTVWKLTHAGQDGATATASVQLTVGNPMMLSNQAMLALFGGANPKLDFMLKKEGESWKITSFKKAGDGGGR